MDRFPDDFRDDNTGAPAGWVNYACELVGDLDLIGVLIARGHAVDYFDASKAVPKLKKILWVSKLVNRLTEPAAPRFWITTPSICDAAPSGGV